MFVISAKKRDANLNLDQLRKNGEIPAVFYGAGKKSTPISVSDIEFRKVWHKAGESTAVVVKTPEGNVDALIHEVQMDPIKDQPVHIDFLAIDMTKKIKVKVPLEFSGVSNAVKSGIGNLVKVLHEIEVEALPKDLPHSLLVDISKLATLADNITVSDIQIPAGVEAVTPATEIVASVVAQVEEKEEPVAPVDLSTIEVEKKGKKEVEGAEGAQETTTLPKEEKGQ